MKIRSAKDFQKANPASPSGGTGVLPTPFRLLIITTVTVFAVEAFIMLLSRFLPPLTLSAWAVLDAFLLAVVTFPVLYRFLFQPMQMHIARRRLAEDALKEKNAFLNTVIESLTYPFYVIDADNYIVRMANSAARDNAETGTVTCYALTHRSPDVCKGEEHPCPLEQVKSTRRPVVVNHIHYDRNGRPRRMEVHGYPIFDADGRVVQMIEYSLDVTERWEAETALRISEQQKAAILNSTSELITYHSTDFKVLWANRAAGESVGEDPENLVGRHCHEIWNRRSTPCPGCPVPEVIRTREPREAEVVGPRGGIWSHRAYPILDSTGSVASVVTTSLDISERKEMERQIRESLREKELLLREIHHRVKNNMQIVSSLLTLQSATIEDPRTLDALNDCQCRMRAIALVHQSLYRSTDLASVDLREYILSLTNTVMSAYGSEAKRIDVKIDVEDVAMGLDTVIPCGMIINELLTNSLKSAFPEGREGEIGIGLHRTKDDAGYELLFRDNGVGLPADLDIFRTRTLGLQLVTSLVERQLNGEVQVKREGGTEFLIRFREVEYH